MKPIQYIFMTLSIFFMFSCTNEDFTPDEKGFKKIEQDLKNKFGEDSFYTDLSIKYNHEEGNVIDVTVTKYPSSLKMKGFSNVAGDWEQISEVELELKKGEIEDYMFRLGREVSVTKIGNLVEKSMQYLTKDTQLQDITLSMASVASPVNGKKDEMLYHIELKSLVDNTYYNFKYDMNGEFCSLE